MGGAGWCGRMALSTFLRALTYFLSYLMYPSRILRSIRNYRLRRSDSIFELRFFAVLSRRRIEKKSRRASAEMMSVPV